MPQRCSRPLLAVLPLIALAGCQAPIVEFECDDGEPLCALAEILADERESAPGVDLTSVYLYQGIEIPLVENRVTVPAGSVPIVAGRETLIRVFVTPRDGFLARNLTARLFLYVQDELYTAFQTELMVDGASVVSDLTSTFNIIVPSAVLLEGDMGWSIEIVEDSGTPAGSEAMGSPEWPDGLPATFPAISPGGPLRLMLVPIQYNADSSARMPDTTDAQLELYQNYMHAMYPVQDFELVVGPTHTTNTTVTAMSGWESLLYEVQAARSTLGAEDDQYIYGIFQPQESFGTFCSSGCIMGMSTLAMSAGDAYNRVSIGVGYSGQMMVETLAHEVGHAHGRYHSPGCGAGGPDPEYPVADGHTDSRGYDLTNGFLMESSTYYDIMSYCSPYWISAFTFEAFFTRIRDINLMYHPSDTESSTLALETRAPSVWHALAIHGDGTLTWGADHLVRGDPGGFPHEIELLDERGAHIDKIQARFAPNSEGTGGILQFPADEPRMRAVSFEGVFSPLRSDR